MTFYANQRCVVTGGCGMVGSHLVEALLAAGAYVLVLDNYARGKQRLKEAQYIYGDAGHERTCIEAFRGAFAVFNLAAHVAGVGYNQRHQTEMFEKNIRLQTAPMVAAAAVNVPHVLQTSSVCVYAPAHNHPAKEESGHVGEPHVANAGYAWAKRMGERAAVWAGLEHCVIVRPSNIYGPRDYFDDRAHVIPALIKKAIHEETIIVNGSGKEQREFIYVEDVARGMLTALEMGQHAGVYNLSTNGQTCTSIADLLWLIQQATETSAKPVQYTAAYDAGDAKRWSDARALSALVATTDPYCTLPEGIARTVAWYKEHHL